MKKKKVLFISSTGGHLNELMQLSPLFEKYEYRIIKEKESLTITNSGAPSQVEDSQDAITPI